MEKFWYQLAWCLPRRLAYWCFVRVASHATAGRWSSEIPDNVSIVTAAGRWKE